MIVEKRKTHAQGPTFSRVIAGAWRWQNVSSETVERLTQVSLEQGITSFDHADIYGDHSNEERFGQLLAKNSSLRNKIELITKCGIKFPSTKRPASRIQHYDTSKEHIIWSAENSLKMLHTDRIDLLLIHRPDPLLNPHEVAEAFGQLRQQGKVLHFGVSNFTPSQFTMLQKHLSFPLVTNQIEISLSRIDPFFNGDLDLMLELGVSPMAWSPLAGGKLMAGEREVFSVATKYDASYSQLALAWLLKHPSNIFPIVGTTKPERIIEAAKSVNVNLDRQDWFEMLKWVRGKDVD
ncbi:MAG: aldo/keto reductase [Bacteroidetes bacterium]|nr:aldo/keto reductase [Bacteroidota bacterium]MBI3481789.1 aldo/keto reductase [Bacteroidota bacterium]